VKSARFAAVLALLALALTGCGAGSEATGDNPGDGVKIFSDAGCGACHTLSAADANGGSGPNLDNVKMSDSEITKQISEGGGGMPGFAGDLTEKQIAALTDLISKN
jgi:mono/diheme cytochrome c family protein